VIVAVMTNPAHSGHDILQPHINGPGKATASKPLFYALAQSSTTNAPVAFGMTSKAFFFGADRTMHFPLSRHFISEGIYIKFA
jgi:hypothetical protein